MTMASSEHPGIGRLAYVMMYFFSWLLTFLVCGLLYLMGPKLFFPLMTEEWHMELWIWGGVILGNLILLVVFSYLAILRLRNLGMSSWWFLGRYVPFLNLWVFWRLLICPAGYADYRQLDLPGKILSVLLVVLFGLPLILVILEPLFSG